MKVSHSSAFELSIVFVPLINEGELWQLPPELWQKHWGAKDLASFTLESMNDSSLALQQSIQQSLQDIAAQMGKPLDDGAAARLYQESYDLLSHITYEALTLARVAGTLLVYQMQKVEAEELAWFRSQVQQCTDDEEVEELIESIHRTDAL